MTSARAWVAGVTCSALVASGCGVSAWAPAAAVSDPGIATGAIAAPRTIDVLPLDVEVWGANGDDVALEQIRGRTESGLIGEVTQGLYQRGLGVGAVMDWSGGFVAPDGRSGVALPPAALADTVNSLARYGERVPTGGGPLPVPYLPMRLGAATGADASLYIGGWGFAGEPETSTGEQIAKGVGIVLIVAVVIVAVIAISKAGGGNALGHAGGAVARGAGKVAVSASRAALRAGNAMVEIARTTAEVDDATHGLVGDVIDAMGHAHAAAEARGDHPDWSGDAALPHHGTSAMFVEMTLVDNRTGLVLWHAHQRFPADPRRPDEVRRVAATLLATLPGGPTS